MLAYLAVILVALLVLGVPIFAALGLPPVITVAARDLPVMVVAQRFFGGIDRFALMAVPLFIFATNVMSKGGMSERILDLANIMVGRFYGGAAMTTSLGCTLFGALSGSSVATVAAIGNLTYPLLKRQRYEERFTLGLIMAAAGLDILIPPHVTMIVYATATNVSVGEVFLSGVGPGLLLCGILLVYSYFYARRRGLRTAETVTGREVWRVFRRSIWALGVPVLVIGGIYGGIFTPTESAAVSAVYAILVGFFIYRELNWRNLFQASLESAIATAQIMILIGAASALSWVLTTEKVQTVVEAVMGGMVSSPWLVLLFMNLVLIIAGMFMDPSAFILILTPLFMPIAQRIGLDPVHLGTIMLVNAAIGMISPPFGLHIFVASANFNKPFSTVARASLPFMALLILGLLIVTFVPEISLWLPRMAYGH